MSKKSLEFPSTNILLTHTKKQYVRNFSSSSKNHKVARDENFYLYFDRIIKNGKRFAHVFIQSRDALRIFYSYIYALLKLRNKKYKIDWKVVTWRDLRCFSWEDLGGNFRLKIVKIFRKLTKINELNKSIVSDLLQ